MYYADKLIKIAYLYEDLMNTTDSGDVKSYAFFLKKRGV